MVGTLERGQGRLRARAHAREGHLSGARRQLHGPELRRRHRHHRRRSQAEGTGAGRLGRLGRTIEHAELASGPESAREQKMIGSSDSRRTGSRNCRRSPRMAGRRWRRCAARSSPACVRAGDRTRSSRSPSRAARPDARSSRFTLKAPPANPPAGFCDRQPAAHRARFPRYVERALQQPARRRRRRRCAA